MRTNPPGEEREEGEGKKPTVVGEPGGLERDKRGGDTVSLIMRGSKRGQLKATNNNNTYESQDLESLRAWTRPGRRLTRDKQRSLMFTKLPDTSSVINYPCLNLSSSPEAF